MTTTRLTDEQWGKVYPFLLGCKRVNNDGEENMRRFVEAVLWVTRTGVQWRTLPAEYGKWNSVFKRFARWSEAGIWEKLLEYMASDPDLEAIQVDSTSIRAHPSAAGALAEKGAVRPGVRVQVLGRSRGGFGTKILVFVDALGYPLRFRLTSDNMADITQAHALIDGYHPDYVTADKGYDADHFIAAIEEQGAIPVIPPRSNRKDPEVLRQAPLPRTSSGRVLHQQDQAIPSCLYSL